MARLTKMPELDIISGFKGTIDFYLYMGVPVARAWPRSPGHIRTAAVMEQWAPFKVAAGTWARIEKVWKDAYIHMAQSSGLSARDLSTKAYLSGLYRYPNEP